MPLEYAYHVISLEDVPDAPLTDAARVHAANVDAFREWVKAEASGQDDELHHRPAANPAANRPRP